MDMRQILGMLQHVKGPNASGEYICRCPAHDDRTASLCVRESDGKVLLHCQAGCTFQAVIGALGIKAADLYRSDGGVPSGMTVRAAKPVKPASEKKTDKTDLGKLVKVYPYTDENGQLLFEVCRYEKMVDGKREKTFRQRRPDPTKQGGYTWSIGDVEKVLYRLPEVVKAVQEKRTVYLVEGEKDADTLAALGYTATTNPGGASKSGATKWLPEHTQRLAGATVVILPDNDEAGINDRRQVAAALAAVCESVKLLDLTKACPGLPKKADISDMLALLGTREGLKALHQLEAETEPLDASESKAISARNAAAEIIGALPGYCVHDGCISTWSEETPKHLCTFTAIVSGVKILDDGVKQEKNLVIDGWTRNGRPLRQVSLPAASYQNMGWITKEWDVMANINPGTANADKVRYVMSEAGSSVATRTVEYTHTGWRKIGNRWAYLHSSGAIGADGVCVSLPGVLGNYRLDADEGCSVEDSIISALTILGVVPRKISVPLLSFVFLAPLCDALKRADCPPAFMLFVAGTTGSRKSTIAALALSFFGRFTSTSLPASFADSINGIRKKAFTLKDMPLVVDDYHPEGSVQGRKKMEDTAQQLSRAFGDLAERSVMNPDRTLASSMPPRSLCIMTGEDMPNIGESGSARCYIVNVEKNDIPADEVMNHLQDEAHRGALSAVMGAYIEWLLPQMDTLPAQLAARYKELRAAAQKMHLGHARAPGNVAHLLVGYEMFMKFLVSQGYYDDQGEGFKSEFNQAVHDIVTSAQEQGKEQREERPGRMFLAIVSELLTAGTATVVDLTDTADTGHTPKRGHIGYMDSAFYYLMPELAYTAVCEISTKKTQGFPLGMRMLFKQMRMDGLCVPEEKSKNATRAKSIGGSVKRYLWIPRHLIDGPNVAVEQLSIEACIPVQEKTPFDE